MNINSELILREAEAMEGEVIEFRREIHRNPEVGFKEIETTEYISSKLKEFNIEHEKGIINKDFLQSKMEDSGESSREELEPTGVVGTVVGEKGEKTVALRADIDALPIKETEKKEHMPAKEGFRSEREGYMHGCGHDGHTAMLLGIAKMLSKHRDKINGKVKLIFQPAEEKGNGAELVMKSGVLEGVNAIFGAHIWSPLEKDRVVVNTGPVMASADKVELNVNGGGGHGASPWETDDPLSASADFVGRLYKIMDRRIDAREPAVLSICKFASGTAFNVIPDSAELKGTLRTFDSAVRKRIINQVEKLVSSMSTLHDLKFDLSIHPTVKLPLINSEREASFVRDIAGKIFEKEKIIQAKPMMTAEDFAFYLEELPGAFILLGGGNGEVDKPHHKPNFDFEESVLKNGVALQSLIALNYLNEF